MEKKNEEEELKEFTIKEHIGGIVFILILILVGWVACHTCNNEEEKIPLTPAEQHQKRIEKCFSPWDGSHRNLEKRIKDGMNDPNSYEHVETVYWDRDSVIFIRTTFRGRNAFGGIITQNVTAYSDLDCNVLEMGTFY